MKDLSTEEELKDTKDGFTDGFNFNTNLLKNLFYIQGYSRGRGERINSITFERERTRFGNIHVFKNLPENKVILLNENKSMTECRISSAIICNNHILKQIYLNSLQKINNDEYIICSGYLRPDGTLSDFQIGITETFYLGEKPRDAVLRGLYEETGIFPNNPIWDFGGLYTDKSDTYQLCKLELKNGTSIEPIDSKLYYNSLSTHTKTIIIAHTTLEKIYELFSERNTENLISSMYTQPTLIETDMTKYRGRIVSVLEKTNYEKNNITLVALNVRLLKTIFSNLCT